MLKKLAIGGVSALFLIIPGVSVEVNPNPHLEVAGVSASTKPTVTITKAPPAQSSLMTHTVEFIGTGTLPLWYQCSTDTAIFQRCTSPHTVTVSTYGSHSFRVRAIDPYFRVSNPAQVTFQVVQSPQPPPPPPPPPSSPTRALFYNLENGSSFVIQGTSFEVSAADAEQFSICAENVTPPVVFTSSLGTQTENLTPFCLQGDDGEEPNPVSFGVGTHTITIADQAHATPVTLTMTVRNSSTPPPPPPSIFPNTADGKPISQLGLFWWKYWNFEEPFIDLMKVNSAQWSVTLYGGARIPWEELWRNGHIDKATGWPKSSPNNTFIWTLGIFRFGAIIIPEAYADTYVATWEGDADVRIAVECTTQGQKNCQRRVETNRVEATFDAASGGYSLVEITRLGQGGVKNIRVFSKSNEAALNAGKILNPRFVEHARRYKVLRFMDVQDASQGRPFRAGDFVRYNYATWAPEWKADYAKAPDAPKFPSFEAMFRMAVETGTAAWVHVAGLPGAPASFNALVEPADSSLWKEACRTNLSTILASSDWASYMDEIVRSLNASGYPSDRMVYLEPWNEVWNWGGPWARMTHCSDGITVALGTNGSPGWAPRYGFGYLAAHAMVEFDRALARAGRTNQAWTLAMGSQMAWDAVTVGSLEGFKRYFADRGIDSGSWLRRVGVTTASYYAGGLNPTSGAFPASDTASHLTNVKAAVLAGTASKTLADWYFTSSSAGSFSWVVANRNQHQTIAQNYGAFFLGDYEGESHEDLPAHLAADPDVSRWYDEFWRSAEGERVTRGWAAAVTGQNRNAIISNYMSIQPRGQRASSLGPSANQPWYDGYYGESTGRTRGLESILR